MQKIVFGILHFAFCILNFSARADSSRIVATVGVQLVSEGDILRRMEMGRCYGDSAATVEQAFIRITNDLLDLEALRAGYGLVPGDSALRAQAAWIDRHTKDPARLRCVRSVFAGDTAAYLRLFVAPTIVNPKLHDLYALDTARNRGQRPFEEWFHEFARANAPVNFIDADLEREVRTRYPRLWWLPG